MQWTLIILEKLVQKFLILPNLSVTNEKWPCLKNCRHAKFGIHAVDSKIEAVGILTHIFAEPDTGMHLNKLKISLYFKLKNK